MLFFLASVLSFVTLAGFAFGLPVAAKPSVMSLNVCTDQLVLSLADPEQIVSLSHLSDDPTLSFFHDRASDYPKNRGLAEEVLADRPDLVVTGTYSLHNTTGLLASLGFVIHSFDYTQTLQSIPADLRRMGSLLGQDRRAEVLAAEFELRLGKSIEQRPEQFPQALAYDQNGVALGANTLADSVLDAAGFRNLAAERGYVGMTPYPLELLLFDKPDLILTSRAYDLAPALADLVPQHPAIHQLGVRIEDRLFDRATWACGGEFTILAVEALAALRKDIEP